MEQTIDALQVPSLTRPVGWLRQKTYQALRKNGAMPAARAHLPLACRPGA